MTAVRVGRVIELDDSVASRWGPRIVEFLRTVTGQAVDQKAVDFWRDVVRIFQRKPKHEHKSVEHREEVGVPERFLKIWDQAAEQILKRMRYDIVVFGHTHAPKILKMLGQEQWYVNTGDWVKHSTYVEITRKKISLKDWLEDATVDEAEFAQS